MADEKISQLPTLVANTDLLLPLTVTPSAILPICTQAGVSNAQASIYQWHVSSMVLLVSAIQNFLVTPSITINVPAGFRFYVEECYIVATSIVGLVSQGTVSFGNNIDAQKYVAANVTTLLTATNTRERWGVNGSDGETILKADVDAAAVGTTFQARFGFRGILYPL